MGWEMVKLGDVCEVVSGGTPKTSVPEYWGNEIVWVTPKDLAGLQGIAITDSEKMLSQEGLNRSSAKPLPAGTVVMSSRAPIGYVGVLQVPGSTNQGCKNFIPSDRIDTNYLAFFLRSNTVMLQQMGTGATFKEISAKRAADIPVPLPPLEEQQRIATILGTVDTTLTRVEKKLSLLQELELNLAASSNDNVRQVSEVFAIGSGTVDPRDPELQHLALVGPENIEKDTGRPINVPTVADVKPISGKYKFEKGDVLYSKIRPNLNKVTVAQTEGLCSADMYVLRPRINLSPEALSAILRLPFFVELAVRSSGRANIPKINRKALSQLQVPLPAESQFEMFGRKIKELNEALSKTYQLHGYLTELYASLSSRAFAGEL